MVKYAFTIWISEGHGNAALHLAVLPASTIYPLTIVTGRRRSKRRNAMSAGTVQRSGRTDWSQRDARYPADSCRRFRGDD